MIIDNLNRTLSAAVLHPIAMSASVHPLHFAAIDGVNLRLGTVTSPAAPVLWLVGHIGNSIAEEHMKPAMFFTLVGRLRLIFLTTYTPALSLTLPVLVGYIHQKVQRG